MKKIIIGGLIVLLFFTGYVNFKLESGLDNFKTGTIYAEGSSFAESNIRVDSEKFELTLDEEVNFPELELEEELKLESNIELRVDNLEEKRDSLLNKIIEHRVKKGENLWEIAHQHDIDIDTLIGANEINNMNWIHPGDVLKILPVKGILYQIGPGENLWNLAMKFKVGLYDVVEANGIEDPDTIQPGTLVILPGAKPEFGYRDRLEKKFILPVHGRKSSPFGKRWGRMHEGMDIAVPIGTNVVAAGSGRVIYSGWARGYGKVVIIEHKKGLRTLYAHNSKLLVHSGQQVFRGQLITKSGNTGISTGPHVHFEVQINGRPVNPENYLR